MVQVLETTLEQIKERLGRMRTNLNKADYLESAFKKDLSIEIKRFALETLTQIYEQDKMYSKAAKAMSNKARFDPTFKERIISYTKAAEFYCKTGSIEDAEDMFNRAFREANEVEKLDIIRTRKEMYFNSAEQLEKIGKKSSAMKFYEKLIKMRLDELEKEKVKEKLIKTYKLLGRFKDADMVSAL
jgi:pentatricopeptide repeat protein